MKFNIIGNTGDTSTLTGTVTTASKTDGSLYTHLNYINYLIKRVKEEWKKMRD
jgi:hypothetical protein